MVSTSAAGNFHVFILMKNLRNNFPTCYAYSVKEPIGELNLKRALDEDTGVFSSFFSLLSSSSPLEFHPSSVILGVFVFFFILIFCESLAVEPLLIRENCKIYIPQKFVCIRYYVYCIVLHGAKFSPSVQLHTMHLNH